MDVWSEKGQMPREKVARLVCEYVKMIEVFCVMTSMNESPWTLQVFTSSQIPGGRHVCSKDDDRDHRYAVGKSDASMLVEVGSTLSW